MNPVVPTSHQAPIGAVVIGRNEGRRLHDCLTSLAGRAAAIIYVDSGSTDGSVALADSLGANVVELDLTIPFTAARARNAGFDELRRLCPSVEYVQFVDGDCEVRSAWLDRAARELAADSRLAVVCGRRRERRPDASLYNRLCDIEWDTPVGDAKACGGDALVRVAALTEIDGYDPTLIAGEEPEMCLRLRRRGWKIRRLDAEMTWHDAAMTRFGQWWRRSVRAGHAYAEGAARYGAAPERHWLREVRSNWLWGLIVPIVAVAAAWPTYGASLLVALAGYALLAFRVGRHARRRGVKRSAAAAYALFTVVGKLPNALGQLQYHRNRLLGRRSRLIEYKGAAA